MKKNTLIDFPNERIEYSGVGNPRFVSDIVNATESILTAMSAIFSIVPDLTGNTDFTIITGLEYDPHPAYDYAPGIVHLNGKYIFAINGCFVGESLRVLELAGTPKLFEDSTTKNIYKRYLADVTVSPIATDSPAFGGNMDSYRLNITALKTFLTANYPTNTMVRNITGGLTTKILDINDWDMNADASKIIPHGLSPTEFLTIRSISATIINDAGTTIMKLDFDPNISGYIYVTNATNVYLYRIDSGAGGVFDSTDYDTTPGLRGYLTITYISD
jgi:hypothetical protein